MKSQHRRIELLCEKEMQKILFVPAEQRAL